MISSTHKQTDHEKNSRLIKHKNLILRPKRYDKYFVIENVLTKINLLPYELLPTPRKELCLLRINVSKLSSAATAAATVHAVTASHDQRQLIMQKC